MAGADFDQSSAGVVLIFSTVTSQSNKFYDQRGDTGAYILATSTSSFVDIGSAFTKGCANSGGFAYVVSSEVMLTDTVVDNMTADLVEFVSLVNESVLSLTNVQVSNCNSL